MEISLRGASHLAKFIPPSGRLTLGPGSTVRDVLRQLGIDDQLVMLVVIDGELGDIQSPLSEGMTLQLIPPISGG